MSLFDLKINKSQIQIKAVEIYQACTFEGGLAIGKHSEDRVMKKIELIKKTLRPLRPSAPFAIILPADLAVRKWCLPFFTCVTWFVSDFAPDDDNMGTQLATVHFQDSSQPHFDDENMASLISVDWPAIAAGFRY